MRTQHLKPLKLVGLTPSINKVKMTYRDQLEELPDGTFVVLPPSDTAYLVYGDRLYPWHVEGYGSPIMRPTTTVEVITPRSTVRALADGYQPTIHPTATVQSGG